MKVVRLQSVLLTFCFACMPCLGVEATLGKESPRVELGSAYARYQEPPLLTYAELEELGTIDEVRSDLKEKMTSLLRTPFLSNEAYYSGAQPICPDVPGLGPSLRVVMWNIERGLRLDGIKLALTDADAFLRNRDGEPLSADVISRVVQELEVLQTADILVLQELDWGMKRTGYREVVRELGAAMNMNWAYAVEFLEVDPIDLGTESFDQMPAQEREQLRRDIEVDKDLYRGLHGTAILSRYPIREVRVIPLLVQGYDWYLGEKRGVSPIELAKRGTAAMVFLEKIFRQVRRGGRTHLFVTLDVPHLPGGRLTVSAPHLEARTKPAMRREQMNIVLSHLREIEHPVIVAGDLNTTGTDNLPTSVKREIYKRVGSKEFWAKRGMLYATGFGMIYDFVSSGIRFLRNQNDPTARNIPVFFSNDEKGLFREIENFRDLNGFAFDLRGSRTRTINGKAGTLANSNQRGRKGFVPTFSLARTVGPAGKFKLDWIFVKSYLSGEPRDKEATYRFAPHFPRTMGGLNHFPPEALSDHHPISVDLPFGDPESFTSAGESEGSS